MELQGLYELHERLGAAAVAGVNLIGDDFRLRRAVEQIRPLAQAVPVIKKLYTMAENVMAPDCEDRPGCLLDALALSEALLCTQAGYETGYHIGQDSGDALTRPEPEAGAEAGPRPLELISRSYAPCLPYSQVHPLEQALTESGGGRLVPITEAMEEHPLVFEDYRLQAAVITALSDRYAEIADAAEKFLSGKDGQIVPLVKRGFWETTDNGRIHRLRVIESICGGAENEFYLGLLKRAKKELRAEVIHALRFNTENTGVLLDLARTEKGLCLEMTEQVLGMMEQEETDAYWEEQFKKKGREIVGYLRFSKSDLVSDRLAGIIEETLNQKETMSKKEFDGLMSQLLTALPGKGSGAMQEVYRRAARMNPAGPEFWLKFPAMLIDSIIYSQDERLISLAGELAGEQERSWLGPALAADFLTKPAAFVYESYCRKIPRDSLLGKEDKRKTRTAVLAVLGRIHCIREDGECEILCRVDEKSGTAHRIGRRLYEKPDSRWMDMLMDARIFGNDTAAGLDAAGRQRETDRDKILFSMLPAAKRAEKGSYFYKRALTVTDNRELYGILAQSGWKDFKGLISTYVKKNPNAGISLWSVQHQMNQLPMTEEERQTELREIDRILCGFPKGSSERRSWDANDYCRKAINEAAGLPGQG